jgi:hypothetical protein
MVWNKEYYYKHKDRINFLRRKNYKKNEGKWHKEYYKKHRIETLKIKQEYYQKVVRKRKGIKRKVFKWEKWEHNILKKYYGKIISPEIQKRYLKNRSIMAIHTEARNLYLKSQLKNYKKIKEILILRNKKNIGKTFEEIYGIEKAKKIKEKFSLIRIGKNNPAYKDGNGKFPYSIGWTNNLKEQIRQRDKNCRICNLSREQHKKSYHNWDLCVHHIDRNKSNHNFFNLICLCLDCHTKIQFFQDDLKDYFYAKNLNLIK